MSRYNIVLAEQPHRQVFAEAVEALTWGLRGLAHEVESSTYPVRGACNIILAPHLLLASDENVSIEPGTIVYNAEPSWSPLFLRSLRLLGNRHCVVWDYSPSSTEFLRGLGIPARTVPFAWCPSLAREPSPLAHPRHVDVLWIGSLSPRRERVLAELARLAPEGFAIKRLFNCYGRERDHWIVRSKVLLNVHYWDEGGCEDLRIIHAASNAVAVVSEGEPEAGRAEWASWRPYEDLAAECVRLVERDGWMEQAARGYHAIRLHNAVSILREALA